ncbi:MAG TPA: right-handed parallel beta-helix repeat-containing protein [Puia sp.]|jgi:hypothetical protein|nr:right-handed parallel beta-helix repeat-containing protein [Puia sp.]
MRNIYYYMTVAGSLVLCLAACRKEHSPGIRQLTVHPGEDITEVVNVNLGYTEFILETGTYTAMHGQGIFRSNIIIRRKDSMSEARITEPLQITGDGNVIDGLTWDGDMDRKVRVSDPGTLAISGSGNIVRNCVFRNMRMSGHGTSIVCIGRLEENSGQFFNTHANNNTIESCTFDNWGLRGEPKGSTKSSDCISVGAENEKGLFTGTTIRNNRFINGPYKEYGYNAAVKVFNPVTLESNLFYGGQECMEIKYGNSTIRGNTIHHFSGYNILANRSGRNNLYEYNVVYDVRAVDGSSSAQGFMIWEAGNTVYRNNLIYDCAQTGLILGKQTAASSLLEYVLIENNSFIGNSSGIHFNNQMGSPRHITVTRNIFYSPANLPGIFMLSGADPASIENYSDNVYYNSFDYGDDSPVKEDPKFTDSAAHDYGLQSGSPACGYGAVPCPLTATTARSYKETAVSPNIIFYLTKKKYLFHVGIAGMDAIPLKMEICDDKGRITMARLFPGLDRTALKVIDNVNVYDMPAGSYTVKIITTTGVIARPLEIP